ncbi:MAG: T9SS type A sorting domain-containing protein [Melioribacteraceae bacterium]|nr:T9SS type A sorting domain-containing protein [Melioribacteraceae bacterium]
MFTKKFAFAAFIILLNLTAINAQVTTQKTIDIFGGIEDSSIELSYSPESISNEDIMKLFDGENFTQAGTTADDSMTVTLIFAEPVTVTKSKSFFTLSAGNWSLELADNIDDLVNRTESYELVIGDEPFSTFSWDSTEISVESFSVIRLTVSNPSSNMVYLGEWMLQIEKNIVALTVVPNPPRLLPGTSLDLDVKMVDEDGGLHNYTLDENIVWISTNQTVASFDDEISRLFGHLVGTTTINVSTVSGSLSGSSTAYVEESIDVPKAEQLTIKVAVIMQDPITSNGQRIHEKYGWSNPVPMVNTLVDEFYNASDGVVNFEIVELNQDQMIFTMKDSSYLSVDSLDYYCAHFAEFKDLAERQGRIKYDYTGMMEYYDYYNKRMNGEIDEVWVYSHPFGGMYESQLIGKEAFWYNSPPIRDVPDWFTKLVSVMGWNYERGIAEAMHSVGHRSESAIVEATGGWNIHSPDPTDWEIFTRIDIELPGLSHIGNIHYPANGTSDYDYSNMRTVTTYADAWDSYPYLLNKTKEVNCTEWGCSQTGYMRWWFGHLPNVEGKTDGILNNWWHYIVDFQEAVIKADTMVVVGVSDNEPISVDKFQLLQNYPNPFNPTTTITYNLPVNSYVKVELFDILGRKIKTLVNTNYSAGTYTEVFDASNFASGVYFYTIEAKANNGSKNFRETKKMMLLK